MSYTHHFESTQNPRMLFDYSRRAAKMINFLVKKTNKIPVLVYSGYSGTALANSILVSYYSLYEIQLNHFFVRKLTKERDCYSSRNIEKYIEEDINSSNSIFIFIDDCIDSGATVSYCKEYLKLDGYEGLWINFLFKDDVRKTFNCKAHIYPTKIDIPNSVKKYHYDDYNAKYILNSFNIVSYNNSKEHKNLLLEAVL